MCVCACVCACVCVCVCVCVLWIGTYSCEERCSVNGLGRATCVMRWRMRVFCGPRMRSRNWFLQQELGLGIQCVGT